MPVHGCRALLAATALALCALVAGGRPAWAAGATITLPLSGSKVFSQDPFVVRGSCPVGSRTVTVSVLSDGQEVAQDAVDVADDLSVQATLDISKAPTGTGKVVLNCFRYADAAPLGSANVEFFLSGLDTAPYDIDVSVAPRTVPLGGTITVSTTCEPGTAQATVYLESIEDPGDVSSGFVFRQATVIPRTNGAVRVQLPITADRTAGFSSPIVGPASATVFCGDPDAIEPTGRTALGSAPFTITAATAQSGSAPNTTAPELANTGSDVVSLLGLAAILLTTGVAVGLRLRTRTRLAQKQRVC